MMNNYDDIINLNRPISKHSHQSIESRASQFAPFAALVGYDSAIKETARLTDKKIEIDDGLKEMLNSKLNYINEHIKDMNEITITYFVKDTSKNGGKYIENSGIVKKIDSVEGTIKLFDNTIISMIDVINIKGNLFDSIFED